ncbi:MAG: Nidogen extracellular domain-containing protein [Bacteroidetes bacterium]|nr:MAG: Nidogen extracellular domain-containing protein [Bacteroidota bacterium]
MKRISALMLAVLFCTVIAAQEQSTFPAPGSDAYDRLKKEGSIPRGFYISGARDSMPAMKYIVQPAPASSVACECMVPVDGTFSIVPFTIGLPPNYENDDGSSPIIALPFNFCFYGQTQSNCYINNNGNISFGAPYGTFSANAFPDPNFVMIAPFWGDVDTRSITSGLVHYKITPTSMIVKWEAVDYFNATAVSHQSLYNTFQLIITDGSDPILPAGNNVSFCYGDMQWTTGDASQGTNGFGGVPATVGVNRGNGIDYVQIGQFDAPGSNYDGPFGNPDQVSWLDNQTFYFDVCSNNGNNLPPVVNAPQSCDTIEMCVGDTLDISATFLSPEQGQTTTIAVNPNGLVNFSIVSNTGGNTATLLAVLVADASNVGYNTISITGTDNGSPAQSTSADVIVHIISAPAISFSFSPTANILIGTQVQFNDATPGAVQWLWNFGDGDTSSLQNPVHDYSATGSYTVSLTVTLATGCTGTLTQVIDVVEEVIQLPVIAPNVFTPNGDGKNDALDFSNLLMYHGNVLQVFNRWGNLVYESADYKNDWQPKDMSDGVYYYTLFIPDRAETLTGFVHLIR